MKKLYLVWFCGWISSGCASLSESLELGAGLGAATGGIATYTSQKIAGQVPSIGDVALGAGIGMGVGLLASYLVHQNVEEKRASFKSEQTELYFGDLPPSPFVFPKNSSKKGSK